MKYFLSSFLKNRTSLLMLLPTVKFTGICSSWKRRQSVLLFFFSRDNFFSIIFLPKVIWHLQTLTYQRWIFWIHVPRFYLYLYFYYISISKFLIYLPVFLSVNFSTTILVIKIKIIEVTVTASTTKKLIKILQSHHNYLHNMNYQ